MLNVHFRHCNSPKNSEIKWSFFKLQRIHQKNITRKKSKVLKLSSCQIRNGTQNIIPIFRFFFSFDLFTMFECNKVNEISFVLRLLLTSRARLFPYKHIKHCTFLFAFFPFFPFFVNIYYIVSLIYI